MTLTLAYANRVIAGAIAKAVEIGAKMNMAEGNHMFLGQGAVPIFRGGVLIGACGVGGGMAQEDEDCARAGVESLQ